VTTVTTESVAWRDLTLDEQSADHVVGGTKGKKRATLHSAAAAPRGPIFIYQAAVHGTPVVSANSGDDDCAPETGDPNDPNSSSV
jgi:hypothetical protein